MKSKFFIGFMAVMLLIMVSVSGVRAATVHLDGVSNAGWWENNLNGPYLNISDDSGYAYQWSYTSGTTLLWTNFGELVLDLNDTGSGLIVNNWAIESGGDPFNSPLNPIWKAETFLAGTYSISLAENSGAYDLKAYWKDETMWNAYVQIWADYGDIDNDGNTDGASFNFGEGEGEGDWSFDTESEALAYYHANIDGMEITLDYDADLYFYLNDYFSLDNGGGVTLDIQAVPVPGTLYLLFSGLGMLIFKRHSRYI